MVAVGVVLLITLFLLDCCSMTRDTLDLSVFHTVWQNYPTPTEAKHEDIMLRNPELSYYIAGSSSSFTIRVQKIDTSN